MAGLDWLTARPVAHRGLHDADRGILENTLSAARAAIAGNYAIEIDVQPDADLEPVVFHDATLDRLTERSGPVAALRAEDLANIPFKATEDRIPTLRALLDAVDGQMPLFVEIKTDGTGMTGFCARIATILADYHGPVAVMSIDPAAVHAFIALAPALPRGIVAKSIPHDKPKGVTWWTQLVRRYLLHVGRTRPHFIAYRVDNLPAVAPLLLRRVFGLPLLTWTVRTDQQRKIGERWADQIIFEDFRA